VLSFGGLIPSLTYLGDIAEVSTGIEPRDGITRYNGRDAVLVQVNKQSGANVVRVAERVKDTLGKIEADTRTWSFPSLQTSPCLLTRVLAT